MDYEEKNCCLSVVGIWFLYYDNSTYVTLWLCTFNCLYTLFEFEGNPCSVEIAGQLVAGNYFKSAHTGYRRRTSNISTVFWSFPLSDWNWCFKMKLNLLKIIIGLVPAHIFSWDDFICLLYMEVLYVCTSATWNNHVIVFLPHYEPAFSQVVQVETDAPTARREMLKLLISGDTITNCVAFTGDEVWHIYLVTPVQYFWKVLVFWLLPFIQSLHFSLIWVVCLLSERRLNVHMALYWNDCFNHKLTLQTVTLLSMFSLLIKR